MKPREGSLYRADRGNTQRHQLSDRATGRFRNIYVPADFAPLVADESKCLYEGRTFLWAFILGFLGRMEQCGKKSLIEKLLGWLDV